MPKITGSPVGWEGGPKRVVRLPALIATARFAGFGDTVEHRDYRSLSFWHDTAGEALEPRAPLSGEAAVDVAIVGAGYTGLWTAYYLCEAAPGLRIALVEAEIAGFGASGRNGGWCLGNLAGLDNHLDDPRTREAGTRLQRALFESVAEVERVCEREAIDCHWARGGSINLATSEAHRTLLLSELEDARERGIGEADLRWLPPEECRARVRSQPNLGGLFLAHCAALHPLRLVRGLARAVERRGAAIFERSPALAIAPGRVATRGGALRARHVVRATEAYTGSLSGHGRTLLPMHSVMVATEPLPETVWKEIGLDRRETFADPRRVVIYGQRTADDRMAFGTRGAYFFGSALRDRFSDAAYAQVQRTLESLFPVLRGCRISHRWGGALGIPRDWRPAVGLDPATGLAFAGGYVGEGVAASNLAGRTLADLILGRQTGRTALPWVGGPPPAWEPEPLRWIGVSLVRRLAESLDAAELAGRRAHPLLERVFETFVRK